MNRSTNPNHSPDLPDPLRRAVAAVRAQDVPHAAMAHSLGKAAALSQTKHHPFLRFRRPLLAMASIAALLLIACLWMVNGNSESGGSNDWRYAHHVVIIDDSHSMVRDDLTNYDNDNRQNINVAGVASVQMARSVFTDLDDRELPRPLPTGSGSVTNGRTGNPNRPISGEDLRDGLQPSLPGYGGNLGMPKDGLIVKGASRITGRYINFETLGEASDGQKNADKALPGRINSAKVGADGKPGDAPQVWKRDQGQPTFARVYVGDKNSLELVSMRVTVTVEGPRARTVVDHVFRNPHDKQLEGTFEYPLPSGASPSYFAMFLGAARDTPPPLFVRHGKDNEAALPKDTTNRRNPAELVADIDRTDWGRLQEGRIVAKDKATETYEDVVRGRVDPALLEYAGGNTFRGRVFPIQAKGFNRVILAYEELLPVVRDKMLYQFPLPDCKLSELQFSLTANSRACKNLEFQPKGATLDESGNRLVYSRIWKNEKPEGAVVFTCTPNEPRVQAVSGRQGENGSHYVYARLRPELKKVADAKPYSNHAVFLLDTSLSENPDRFNVSMKLLRKVLESDADIKQFNILTFNVATAWVEPKGFLPNTTAGRETAFGRLNGLVLEGATDLSVALDRLARNEFELPKGAPLNCFLLSDGQITWGDADVTTLLARFEKQCPFAYKFNCYRTGIGAENGDLYAALVRKGGGVFNCFTDADVANAAQAHKNQCMQVSKVRFVGGPEASDVLVAGRQAAVYPGGEMIVAARINGAGKTKIVVDGTFQGAPVEEVFPLEIADGGELAPRAWAEVAVASLLGLNDPTLDPLVTAYCQQFGVVSRVASFLVLENDADYKRFNLDDERGKTAHEDLADYLAKKWAEMGEPKTTRRAFLDLLGRIESRAKLGKAAEAVNVYKLLVLLEDRDFDLPPTSLTGQLVHTKDVAAAYLTNRAKDPRDVSAYLTEAKRRARNGDLDGAVRVLSSVIEEHPTRDDALRLVGYRLLDLKQPGQAARLFQQVQRQRPFEPHSYRDLARSLEDSGLYGLAAIEYEIVLAGTWHNRFGTSLKEVVLEEYARMMQEAIRRKAVSPAVANHFGERLEQLSRDRQPAADLRVTISWNTDATDIDLWVIEPDGTKCYYEHNRTKNGGKLSQDQTQGYGPERYTIEKAPAGEFKVMVHYFRANPNLLGGETHVNVVVTRNAGRPQEVVERHTVILKQTNEAVEVSRVKY